MLGRPGLWHVMALNAGREEEESGLLRDDVRESFEARPRRALCRHVNLRSEILHILITIYHGPKRLANTTQTCTTLS